MSSITTTTTLLGLPTEIQLYIIKFLDYPSSIALSHTNQRFRVIVPKEPPWTHGQFMSLLLDMERWRKYDRFFACRMCLRLRHKNAFVDEQLQGKHCKTFGTQRDRRFCFDCGCYNKMYQPGDVLKVNGRDEVLCAMCRDPTRERCRLGRYCTTRAKRSYVRGRVSRNLARKKLSITVPNVGSGPVTLP
ncbi:unnamed protein product [Penicillium salamii]|uniref:F-box domain-containing protein n=1 Tax=Penicillium salamii TaxID=1612424 RepID=A0A9W4K337_9EURO|nr:unnamed protein product [Penicillium salamii]CAG7955890.1 unnamed protein product [Penicillium salamii]CAG8189071.1 unnamed protein product [Penicillium salamii]CAG8192492.1 unnamed protein product [Penicillium salamii]CAG8226274.1 unnamed protein product [Penicillium salamii]